MTYTHYDPYPSEDEWKGLPRLALPDSDKEDKSAHVKCYIYQK